MSTHSSMSEVLYDTIKEHPELTAVLIGLWVDSACVYGVGIKDQINVLGVVEKWLNNNVRLRKAAATVRHVRIEAEKDL